MRSWKQYVGLPVKDPSFCLGRMGCCQPSALALCKSEVLPGKGRDRPGPINNEDILDDPAKYYLSDDADDIINTPLRPEMKERIDYKILNAARWDFLYSHYGGRPIRRYRYKPEFYTYFTVEVYLHPLNLVVLPPKDRFSLLAVLPQKIMLCSKRWTVSETKKKMARVLGGKRAGCPISRNFRLWKLDPKTGFEEFALTLSADKVSEMGKAGTDDDVEENSGLDFPGTSLDLFGNRLMEKCDLGDSDIVVIEQSTERGEFIFRFLKNVRIGKCEYCCQERALTKACRCKEAFYCSDACLHKDAQYHSEKCTAMDEGPEPSTSAQTAVSNMGLTGLQNLGNTCFLNAGLQCLSNTWELTRYFLEKRYVLDLNTTNKLGMQGKMALAYAQLLRLMWYDNSQFVAPWEVKKVIGRFHSAFSGHAQQDCHELINAIVDGLHEDLNRVRERPYVEQRTTDDPNDDSLSTESWKGHLTRNQSIIVDLMHGQFKSSLRCPKCGRYSCKFDPFSAVMLPVAEKTLVHIVLYYVPFDVSKPIVKSSLDIDREKTVDELRGSISSMLGVSRDATMMAMMSGGTFDKFLCRTRKVGYVHKMQEKHHSYLYVMEIDPDYINSADNVGAKEIAKRRADKGIVGPAKTKDNDDYNNGLSDEIVRVSLSIYQFVQRPYWRSLSKECRANNRFVYIKRNSTMKDLHMAVLKLLSPLLLAKQQSSPAEQFASLFSGLDEDTWETRLRSPNNYPYTLRFINPEAKAYYKREKCVYCGQEDCDNCAVPFSDRVRVEDILSRINHKEICRNDYYYYEHEQTSENKKDMELEIVFNQDPSKWKFDIQRLDAVETYKDFRDSPSVDKPAVSIYDCFDAFSQWETLDPTNLWYCNKCKDHVQASKRIEIFRVPLILILQIKRFKVTDDGRMGGGIRIDRKVDFPLEGLNLSRYVKFSAGEEAVYDLFAVSNHYGSMGFGHYVTFAKNHLTKNWYKFDDARVTQISEAEICSPDAYILFYKRKSLANTEVDYDLIRQGDAKSQDSPITAGEDSDKGDGTAAESNDNVY